MSLTAHGYSARLCSLLRRSLSVAAASVLCAVLALTPARATDQPAPTIGRIEGNDIDVKGPVSVEVSNGFSTTLLASGSEISVRSGQARVELNPGGEVGVCGPAHFSLHKSGEAITLALDFGRVHARLDSQTPFTIYTPMIVATPVAIGDSPREATLALDQAGVMRAVAASGAVRIEQQLSAQTLLLPQGGSITMEGGQIASLLADPASCACDIIAARASTTAPATDAASASAPAPAVAQAPPSPSFEVSRLNKPLTPLEQHAAAVAPATEEPIYHVLMPALTFDANSPAPPTAPDPSTILLVREVRVRPLAMFRGHINPAPLQAAEAVPSPALKSPAATPPAPANPRPETHPPQAPPSFFERVKNFFRKLSN